MEYIVCGASRRGISVCSIICIIVFFIIGVTSAVRWQGGVHSRVPSSFSVSSTTRHRHDYVICFRDDGDTTGGTETNFDTAGRMQRCINAHVKNKSKGGCEYLSSSVKPNKAFLAPLRIEAFESAASSSEASTGRNAIGR